MDVYRTKAVWNDLIGLGREERRWSLLAGLGQRHQDQEEEARATEGHRLHALVAPKILKGTEVRARQRSRRAKYKYAPTLKKFVATAMMFHRITGREAINNP